LFCSTQQHLRQGNGQAAMAKQAAILVPNFCTVDSDPPVNGTAKSECW